MKKKNIFFSIIAVFAVVSTLFFYSCSEEPTDFVNDEICKDLVLSDAENQNSIVMRISSDDPSILEYYNESNFVIIPISTDQSFSDAVSEYYALNPINEEINDCLEDENDIQELEDDANEPSVNMTIIDKKLYKGVRNIAITVITPDFGDVRGFSTQHHYSYNQESRCEIERTSWAHRVYYGLFYKKYESNSWTEIKGFPTKLSNNDPKSYHYDPCYKYDLKVKARKSKHYTYAFEE